MPVAPAFVLLAASVALGLYLGWRYLRRVPNRPVHIGVHLLLGVAGLEAMVLLLRGAPDGTRLAAGSMGNAAALCLLLALMAGLATPLVAKRRARKVGTAAIAAHAGLAAAGFGLFLAWAIAG